MPEYIEREALRKSLLIGAAYLDEDTMMTVVNVLDCFPAADVAPVRHGRWIAIKVPNEWDKGQCSECRSIFNSSVWGTNYCPNCGADMRGSNDE